MMEDETFFYPNVCHVCKRWDVKLMSCAKCQMISYCSEGHREEHLPQHQEICAAIKHVLEDKEYMNTEEISEEEWYIVRDKYLVKVEKLLQRDLKNEESEMILFPKACEVCHRQDTVIRCNYCPSAAFCDKHRDEIEHQENCIASRKCLKVNMIMTVTKTINMTYVDRFSNKMRNFNNMSSFLNTYLPLDEDNVYLQMLHSHAFTYCLTVYFCIQKLGYLSCETLSIHVIEPHFLTHVEHYLWKLLLLLIPTLTTLTISFIQTESKLSECDMSREVFNVSDTKKLEVYVHYMPYEEYMGTADFKKPNFIVGFQSYINDGSYAKDINVDISEESGRALAESSCPCILIFDYISQAHEKIVNKIRNDYYFGINPFTGLMLHRHFETWRTVYPNNYLIIFINLDSSNVFIDGHNRFALFTNTTRE